MARETKSSRILDSDAAWILGVCATLARRLHLDNAVVRVVVTVAALFAPKFIIAAYLVAWLLLDGNQRIRRSS
ncbi:MAG: PspC domain-containing protein [Pseudomonadota bacterium]